MELFQVVVGTYEKVLFGWSAVQEDDGAIFFERTFAHSSHTGCIKSVALSNQFLASASSDETVKSYDMIKKREIGTMMTHKTGLTCAHFFESSHLLSGDESGKICVFRSKDWECVKVLKGHKLVVNSVAIHPSGKLALSVGQDRMLHLWDLAKGLSAFSSKMAFEPELVKWSPSGDKYLLVSHHAVRVYSLEGALLETIEGNMYKHILAAIFLTDKIIAYGGEDKEINIVSLKKGKSIHTLRGFDNRIKDLAVIPKSSGSRYPYLISISSDYRLKLWDLNLTAEAPVADAEIKARPVCVAASVIAAPTAQEANSDEEESEEVKQKEPKEKKTEKKVAPAPVPATKKRKRKQRKSDPGPAPKKLKSILKKK
eukprot:TRINITY_DN5227_c0_g1_i1.p1 TRINITY_DN5227_c0_g1~~TRINITY_DN5227_c0_g1_i1.p1  ORF type:complete len:382 (-),score=92.64 TRINITY_DN5227_c0_g1_i1:176-1285(-)